MTQFRAYVAVSLDGYIATPDGGVEWLEGYDMEGLDFDGFIQTIGVTVMGRKTFDQALERGDWQGGKKDRTVVLTHRPIDDPPPGVETFGGDVRELAKSLREELSDPRPDDDKRRDVWLIGGADSIRAFHGAGLVDRWEIFIAPVLLGDGIPLFPRCPDKPSTLKLTHMRQYEESGFVEVWYEPKAGAHALRKGLNYDR